MEKGEGQIVKPQTNSINIHNIFLANYILSVVVAIIFVSMFAPAQQISETCLY